MSDALRRAAAWATVGSLARLLDGIAPIAPLKGALLDVAARPGRAARMADVDVLVPEQRYRAAHHALEGAGIRCIGHDRDDRARMYSGGVPATVDLHQRLFKAGLFRVPTAGLFSRATRDVDTYGAPVWILDPRDTYAHLLGHSVAERQVPAKRARALIDLREWANHHELDAADQAKHLAKLGMARAARMLLAEADVGDDFARRVLSALPRDPWDTWVVRGARRALEPDRPVLVRTMGVHALNSSLLRGAASLAAHLVLGARQRWIDPDPPRITDDPRRP